MPSILNTKRLLWLITIMAVVIVVVMVAINRSSQTPASNTLKKSQLKQAIAYWQQLNEYQNEFNRLHWLLDVGAAEIQPDYLVTASDLGAQLSTALKKNKTLPSQLSQGFDHYLSVSLSLVSDIIDGTVDVSRISEQARLRDQAYSTSKNTFEQALKLTNADISAAIEEIMAASNQRSAKVPVFIILALIAVVALCLFSIFIYSKTVKAMAVATQALSSGGVATSSDLVTETFSIPDEFKPALQQFENQQNALENLKVQGKKSAEIVDKVQQRASSYIEAMEAEKNGLQPALELMRNIQEQFKNNKPLSDLARNDIESYESTFKELLKKIPLETPDKKAHPQIEGSDLGIASSRNHQAKHSHSDQEAITVVEQASASEEVVEQLTQKTKSIATILGVIKSIAEQTNLLALNAAIEAARAGDQGRGFAVVADEVRALAVKTQDSTNDIEAMIGELQAVTEKIVSIINDTQESQPDQDILLQLQDFVKELMDSLNETDSENRQLIDYLRHSKQQINQLTELFTTDKQASGDQEASFKESIIELTSQIQQQLRLR